ncbi:MAG: DAK2 domain-containing protein, partial [Oscillospiraceae bacterium]|nr:DAK2 domain-containing protein [Oscillospiraceae bacterium]
EQTPAEIVYVFPNNKNIIMAAEQCIPLTEKKVVIIPTRTIPQSITALINMDANMEEEDLTRCFNEAIETVHTGLITHAARDSDFDGKHIIEGQLLSLLEGKLLSSGEDMEPIIKELAASLGEFEPELVTLYYGDEISAEQAEKDAELVQSVLPDAEVSVVDGGQPVYKYIISAE